MKRYIMTGATGWLGQNIQAALATRNSSVRALVEEGHQELLVPGVEPVVGRLQDTAALQALCAESEGATLLHLAAVIHPRRTREYRQVNVLGTRNLIAAADRAGVARVVLLSSSSVCGFNRDGRPFDESSPLRPKGGYGKSKAWLESSYGGRSNVVILRAPWFYGPFQPERQTKFFEMCWRGHVPMLGKNGGLRSLVYVPELAQSVLTAAALPVGGRRFWIADPRPYSFAEIVATIRTVIQEECGAQTRPRREIPFPRSTAVVAGLLDSALQGMGSYSARAHVLSELGRSIVCSTATAQEVLEHDASVGLEAGTRNAVRQLLARGWSPT